MPAHEVAFVPTWKNSCKDIMVYLVEAANLEQIEHVDQMFDQHGREAAEPEHMARNPTLATPIQTIVPWNVGL